MKAPLVPALLALGASAACAQSTPPALPASPATAAPGAASGAARQSATSASVRAAMRRLQFLVGEWEGDGWIRTPDGTRHLIRQRETVRFGAGGDVLVIDGLGRDATPGGSGRVVHEAFAIVWVDRGTGSYRWHSFRGGAGETTTTPEVGDGRFVWSMRPPNGGEMRYTITLTPAGEWHEVGEYSRDGSSWSQFFEMTLQRR